jgi:hypothetical protein
MAVAGWVVSPPVPRASPTTPPRTTTANASTTRVMISHTNPLREPLRAEDAGPLSLGATHPDAGPGVTLAGGELGRGSPSGYRAPQLEQNAPGTRGAPQDGQNAGSAIGGGIHDPPYSNARAPDVMNTGSASAWRERSR